MKTRNIIIAAALVLTSAACTTEAEMFRGSDKKSNTPMSATELKCALQDEVLEAINQIDFASETDLIDLVVYYQKTYSGYAIPEEYHKKIQEIVSEENTYPVAEAAAEIMNSMAVMLKSPSAAVTHTYKDLTTISAGLKNVTGILTANEETGKFDYAPADDRLEIRFKDYDKKDCSFILKGSSKSTKVHYEKLDKWSDNYYTGEVFDSTNFCTEGKICDIDVPTRINVTIKAGKKELASLVIKSGVAISIAANEESDWSVDLKDYDPNYGMDWHELMDTTITSVDFSKLSASAVLKAGEYSVKADAIIAKGKAVETAGMYKGSRELLSECIRLPYEMRIEEAIDSLHSRGRMAGAAVLTDKIEATVALGDVFVTGWIDTDKLADDEAMSKFSTPEEFIEYTNKCYGANIYYGEDRWQANFTFTMYGPTIEFADGSMYAISDVIDEYDFRRVMYNFQGLVMDLQMRIINANKKFGSEVI